MSFTGNGMRVMAIAGAQNSRYDAGVQLLEKAAAILHAQRKSAEFVQQLEALLVKYKLKKNLLKLVAKRREFLYNRGA
jgi:hypothetical protein